MSSFTAILADIMTASNAFEAGARDFRSAIPDIVDGAGHTVTNTVKDLGHITSSIWHGVFG